MDFDPRVAQGAASKDGRTYYFCSNGCREKFVASPAKYIFPEHARVNPLPEMTIYTCPMHPQIRRTEPGNCPICGMALEPIGVAEESGRSPS